MAHQRIGNHAAGQLAETDHDLLRRSQRADFDVSQIQSRLERRQDHRIELLEPVNDKMAGGENSESQIRSFPRARIDVRKCRALFILGCACSRGAQYYRTYLS